MDTSAVNLKTIFPFRLSLLHLGLPRKQMEQFFVGLAYFILTVHYFFKSFETVKESSLLSNIPVLLQVQNRKEGTMDTIVLLDES
jgi:hypothetical protein